MIDFLILVLHLILLVLHSLRYVLPG